MPESPSSPRLRLFESAPGQRHVLPRDRYLYRTDSPRYRLGLIGAGTMGQEHMRVAALIGEACVHGVFDTQRHSVDMALANSSPNAPTPRVYDTLDAMIRDPDLDAFFICTPNHTHCAMLGEVAKSAKPIFLEKPMATTLEDAAAMATLARSYPSVIQVGLQYRFKAPYLEAWHEVMERGSAGTVHTLAMSEHRPPFLDKVGQWNKYNEKSGGTLVEKCCHYFDLMRRFANQTPVRVLASGGQAVNFRDFAYDGEPSDVDDHAFVIIEFDGGIRGSFTLNMFAPSFHEELNIVGDRGRVIASERFDHQRPGATTSRIRVESREPHADRETDVSFGSVIANSGHSGSTYHEHLAFLDRLDGMDSGAATISDGLWAMLMAIAAQESMASGEPVLLEPLIDQHGLAEFLA